MVGISLVDRPEKAVAEEVVGIPYWNLKEELGMVHRGGNSYVAYLGTNLI